MTRIKLGHLLVALLFLLPLITLMPVAQAVPPMKTITGKLLRADASQGWIKIPSIIATSVSHDADLFYFLGLSTNFPTLGLAVSAGGNVTSLTLGVDSLTLGVTSTFIASTSVYAPEKLVEPASVTGASGGSWDAVTRVYTFTTTGPKTVTLSWVTVPLPTDAIQILLSFGNMFGAVATFYALRLGFVFPGLVAFAVSAVLYIRSQEPLYAIAAWLLIGGTLVNFLPGDVVGVARVITVVGLSVLIIKVFLGRNSDSG